MRVPARPAPGRASVLPWATRSHSLSTAGRKPPLKRAPAWRTARSEARSSCGSLVERQRRGEVAIGVDLLLAFGELLLGLRDRIGAGDEPERRLCLVRDGQERVGELGRVANLVAVHAVPELVLRGVALDV